VIYISLFLSAFFAATIFPAQSELVLLYLLQDRSNSVVLLLLVATVGNVLGAVVNYGLGYYVHRFKDRRWFPASPQQLEKAQRAYARWGRYSLLASWVPIIGDPITVVAGVLRDRFTVFLALVTVAKAGRYLVLAVLTL
jgi:membrane protein YqaA with SNARE-associated domain